MVYLCVIEPQLSSCLGGRRGLLSTACWEQPTPANGSPLQLRASFRYITWQEACSKPSASLEAMLQIPTSNAGFSCCCHLLVTAAVTSHACKAGISPIDCLTPRCTSSALFYLQASAGLSYSFSVYAPSIKDTLGLSQTEIATVGSAVNLGGYFAIFSGTIYDKLKDQHKLGPRLVVWLGSLCCFCGYMGMYLLASGMAPSNFTQLLLLAVAAGNAGEISLAPQITAVNT